ncbi:CidA/LrgA family protein [Reinekea forsetii]|nr:CidA/LrgA family protein [Reinekea forsetii]
MGKERGIIVFGLFVLLLYWFLGSAFVAWVGWPIPGSVVGLMGLWLTLVIYGGVPNWLKLPSNLLIRYLTLMFVPAGVGLIEHLGRLYNLGVAMFVIIAVSTLLTVLAMALVFKLLGRQS